MIQKKNNFRTIMAILILGIVLAIAIITAAILTAKQRALKDLEDENNALPQICITMQDKQVCNILQKSGENY